MTVKLLGTEPRALHEGTSILVAVLVAVAAGAIAANAGLPDIKPDVDQLWFAARAILDGRNPYDLIGPGKEFEYEWRLYYPLPAALLLTPLASFPVEVSRVFMAAAGGGLLAYGIARSDARGLVIFLSHAFYVNAWYAQWTPLLVAMWYLPWLAFLVAGKPTIGIAMFAGVRDRRSALRALATALLLVAIAFLVQPGWFGEWTAALSTNTHLRPWVTVPGGALLFLALIRWRRWEAWLLSLFAIIPQTFHPLATLPMILLPGSLVGKASIAALTYLPNWLLVREPFGSRLANSTAEETIGMYGIVVLWSVLVPTLLLVIRLPNHGPLPAFVERWVAKWPEWLRGSA